MAERLDRRQTEQIELGAYCDIEQYRCLKRCSTAKDTTRWNNWRSSHPEAEVRLTGANLRGLQLAGAALYAAHLEGAQLSKADLKGANLSCACLKGADLTDAHLERTKLTEANLERARLYCAQMEKADLSEAHLEQAMAIEVHLKCATLDRAHLQGTLLHGAHMEGARLHWAHLAGANLCEAHLEGASFDGVFVDGQTKFWACTLDRETDFGGVGLDSAIVEPGLKHTLLDNVRCLAWKRWYRTGPSWKRAMKKVFVQGFWWLSDYGRSSMRLLAVFFALALAFALVYYTFPDLVANQRVPGGAWGGEFIRVLYFSVVTMTTLGFGDMHAEVHSRAGHILLMLQALLGYILLAALVTRLAVLFTASGPAQPRAKRWKASRVDRPGTGRAG